MVRIRRYRHWLTAPTRPAASDCTIFRRTVERAAREAKHSAPFAWTNVKHRKSLSEFPPVEIRDRNTSTRYCRCISVKAIRDQRRWTAGTRLIVEDTPD